MSYTQVAYNQGVWAAHEGITPLCPYSSVYEASMYRAWYDGLAYERRAMQGD